MDNITDYLKTAFKYKEEGEYKKSLDFFYKALALENDSVEIISELAYIYSELCQYDRALSLYEQIIGKENVEDKIKFNYALLLSKLKENKKAKSILFDLYQKGYKQEEMLEELFPILLSEEEYELMIKIYKKESNKVTSNVVMYCAGSAYMKTGEEETAYELFEKSFQKNNIDAGYSLALILYEKKLYEECEILLNKLLKYSEDDKIFYLLGEIRYQNKKTDEAVKNYSYAIKLNPKVGIYYYKLGIAYSLNGFLSEAEQSYCSAIRMEPDNIAYKYTLAYLYYIEKKETLAQTVLEEIMIKEPLNINAISLDLIIKSGKNDVEICQRYIRELYKAEKRDDFSWYAEGVYYARIGMWERAINALIKASDTNPDSLEYKYLLLNSYYNNENYELAENLCKEILNVNGKYLPALIIKAKIEIFKNNLARAEETLNECLSLDINCHEVHYLKGNIRYKSGDYEEAAKEYKTAISIKPKEEEYYASAAKSYYSAAQYEAAYEYYKEAAEINLTRADYRFYMAKCCIKNNEKEKALTNFSIMKRLAPGNLEFIKEYALYLKSINNKRNAINVVKDLIKHSNKEQRKKLQKLIEIIKNK